VPVSRSTSKQLVRARERSLVARAAIEEAERNAAIAARERINNGYQLAGLTALKAGQLEALVTQGSRGKPALEAELRDLEATVLYGAKAVIAHYVTR
jgi:hypothetical protein